MSQQKFNPKIWNNISIGGGGGWPSGPTPKLLLACGLL